MNQGDLWEALSEIRERLARLEARNEWARWIVPLILSGVSVGISVWKQ